MSARRWVVGMSAWLPLLWASSAQGSVVTLFLDSTFGSTENTGVTAELKFVFMEDGADDLLALTIENTTSDDLGSKLTAVGFELPDNLPQAPVFVSGGEGPYFDTLSYDVSISPGWLNAPDGYDLIISGDGNFQGGTPQGALAEGGSELVTLNLGDTGMTPMELEDNFRSFFKSMGGQLAFAISRFQVVGPDGEDSDIVGGGVPEPTSLLLLACGGLFLVRRRTG